MRALRFALEVTALVCLVLGFVWCANVAPWFLVAGLLIVVVLAWLLPRTRRPHREGREQ